MERGRAPRLRTAAAGAVTDLDDTHLPPDISSFMDSLTDRHLQVMQEGMYDSLTREQIGLLISNIVKIVTKISLNIILPKLEKPFKMDSRSVWTLNPDSSHELRSPAKRLASQTSVNRDELLGVTEESILQSVHESLSQALSGLPDSCSSTSFYELSADIVQDVFRQVNMAAKMLKSSSDDTSPCFSLGQHSGVQDVSPEVMNTDASLSSVTSEVMTSIVITDSLEEKQESPVLNLLNSVANKLKFLAFSTESSKHLQARGGVGDKEPADEKLLAKSIASTLFDRVQGKLRKVLTLWNSSMPSVSSLKTALVEFDLNTCTREVISKILIACKKKVTRDSQLNLEQHYSDTSLVIRLFVDGIIAHLQQISTSSSSTSTDDPKTPLQEFDVSWEEYSSSREEQLLDILTSTDDLKTPLQEFDVSWEDYSSSGEEQLLDSVIASVVKNAIRAEHPSYHSLISFETDKLSAKLSRRSSSRSSSSDWEDISLSGTSVWSSEYTKSGLQSPSIRKDGAKSGNRVSMNTLVDWMMATLDLEGPGHLNCPEDLFTAAKRLDDLLSRGTTDRFICELNEMVHLVLNHRMVPFKSTSNSGSGRSREQNHIDTHSSFAYEFLCDFAEESVRRLFMCCVLPRPNSASSEDLPSLVMPFNITPKSFEVSRCPSELYDDTVDMFTKFMVRQILNMLCEPSDLIVDVASCAEGSRHSEDVHTTEDPEKQQVTSNAIETSPAASCKVLPNQAVGKDFLNPDGNNNNILATVIILRILAKMAPSSPDLTKGESSEVANELIGRILSDMTVLSSSGSLTEVLRNTFVELLQRFGSDCALRRTLDPQDCMFEEGLVAALQKQLDAHASPASNAPPGAEERSDADSHQKKGVLSHLKMPKLNFLKKLKRKKSKNINDRSFCVIVDADHGPNHCSSHTGRSSSSKSVSKKIKGTKHSIFARILSALRMCTL